MCVSWTHLLYVSVYLGRVLAAVCSVISCFLSNLNLSSCSWENWWRFLSIKPRSWVVVTSSYTYVIFSLPGSLFPRTNIFHFSGSEIVWTHTSAWSNLDATCLHPNTCCEIFRLVCLHWSFNFLQECFLNIYLNTRLLLVQADKWVGAEPSAVLSICINMPWVTFSFVCMA
jgi:hypothetical protein